MPAKGSTPFCCCGGCASPPFSSTGASIVREIQPLQQYCCACAPLQLCVHYTCGDETYFALFSAVQFCETPEEGEQFKYEGQLVIDGDLVDVEFTFDVDREYGTCSFCLSSSALGIYGDCQAITDETRALLCPRCTPCTGADIFTWEIDGAACSGTATISVRPAANTSIPALPRCCECDDPCDDEPYQDIDPYYDQSCGGPCAGCGCICSQACITVVRDQEIVFDEIVDLCRWAYRTEIGLIVSVTSVEGSGCCVLELSSEGEFTIPTESSVVTLGGQSNPCPNPTARWEFTDDDGQQVIVLFDCAACAECPGVVASACCTNDAARLPRVLHATAVGSAGCCGTIELLMVWSVVEQGWLGFDEDVMCNHDIRLLLTCTASGWELSFVGAPCLDQSVFAEAGGTCSPLDLVFKIPLNGILCCDGAASGTLTVTVTE